MKLRAIHVEGFGLLREKTLQLDGPLTVLYGRNEAGKSTLMGFIRAVLFGFPPRASGAERFEPLPGAAHGGYLTLETDEGERIRVERREGAAAGVGRARSPGGGNVRVTLASGAQGGAELLQPLLGGITGELFRSLFAFSLSELQEVRTLQSDALSGYLYSAGLGARGDTIMAAERKLALEMEQLFRPRGRNQALNQTLQQLEEQEINIRRSKEQAGRYNDYLTELTQLEEQIHALDLAVREQRQGVAWLEAAEQARGHWLRNNEIRLGLAKLPDFEQFPEDAMTRFNHLAKDKDLLLNEWDKQQHVLQQLQNEIEQIIPNPALLENQTELEGLYDQLTAYRVNQTTANEVTMEIEQQQLQLDRILRQISAQWNENILVEYAVTVLHREQVRQWADKLDLLQRNRDQSKVDLNRLSLQVEEAREKANKLEVKLQQKQRQIYDDLTLEAQHEMDALTSIVTQLRKQQQQKQQLRLELLHLEQRELTHDGQAVETDRVKNAYVLKILRWFSLIVNGMLPLYLVMKTQQIAALISFFVLTAVSLSLWFYSPKPANGNRSQRLFLDVNREVDINQSEKDQLKQQFNALETSLSQRLHQLNGLAHTAAAGSPNHKTSALPSAHPLSDQQVEGSFEILQQAAIVWREGKQELTMDEQRWQEAADVYDKQHKLKKLDEFKLEALDKALKESMDAWQMWLIQNQLAAQLSPTGALEIFQLIETGQQQLQIKHRNEAKRETLLRAIAGFEQQTQSMLGTLATYDIPASLKKWKEAAQRTQQDLQQKERLEHQLTLSKSELLLLEESMERINQRIRDLWLEAGAADEQQFRLHVRQQGERVAWVDELQQLEAALDVFIGTKRRSQLEDLLLELTPQELKQKINEDTQSLKENEQNADHLKENRGKLRNELEKLEQGAEHSERLQHIQEQSAVLTEQAGQWATAAFCSALFRKARELYERERQPGVLLLATEYFHEITAGEYVRVVVPLGEKRIVVEHASGRLMDSSLLSRGTAEQLYLAMRFALAEEYASKASLPLILDDILVNFDKERMQQTISLLARISQKHQIIFFTCHLHMAEAFSQQIPGHQQIELV